jgi:hypothetical protein
MIGNIRKENIWVMTGAEESLRVLEKKSILKLFF